FLMAWRGVTRCGMTRMEAWWWLSVPHAAIFGLYFRLLRLDRFAAHFLTPYVMVFMMAIVSAGLWTLVAIYRALNSAAPNLTEKKNVVMLTGVIVLGFILWAMRL